ncbi:hypothetical protein QAD02_016644 [Eretmocerus hayati]|uniref:Uncharacterized protein n=1 Tax=Eretmocerus hayati TaxID=131215 RepID=A0ACC2PC24_9HYME|nr:hypothetical protein QAD02_016644 [Eretmocerus hayati]
MSEGEDQTQSKPPKAPRYTTTEKVVILGCIEPWKKIIENVRTNAIFKEAKSDAWKQIAEEYADISPDHHITVPRSVDQLKAFWKSEKQKSRHLDSDEKLHAMGTGGGEPLKVDPIKSSISSLVHNIQPNLDFTLENEFDSSAQFERSTMNTADVHVRETVNSSVSDKPVKIENPVDVQAPIKIEAPKNFKIEGKIESVDLTLSETGTDNEDSQMESQEIDDFVPPDERDEEDLVELHKKLSERAKLKRIQERAALRENLLNEVAVAEKDYSRNKKDNKPSKQQRKIHGNPRIKVEKVKMAAKTRVAARGKTVGHGSRINRNSTQLEIRKKLKYRLQDMNPSALQSPSTSKIDLEPNSTSKPHSNDGGFISDPETSPLKVLVERMNDTDNSSGGDSPVKSSARPKKPIGIFERRVKKCQENRDPDDQPLYKKIKVQTSASEMEQNERMKRIEESRLQQREFHLARMKIMNYEEKYWITKNDVADLEKTTAMELAKRSRRKSF